MREYLLLQFRIINRKLVAFGIPLFVVYGVFPLCFYWLSYDLFAGSEYPGYLCGVAALGFVLKLSESSRNDFLKMINTAASYRKVRVAENLFVILPFALFLTFKGLFIIVLGVIFSSIILGFFSFDVKGSFTIPTPFGKRPFEFTVGFRKTFFMLPIAYFLTGMAVVVGNFNLGVFTILMLCFVCFSYFSKTEKDYYVWSFNLSAKEFLIEKVKTCFVNFTLLCSPIILALSVFFFEEIEVVLFILIICYTYLITMIFAKYAAFPEDLELPQYCILSVSFVFPIALLGVIPFFYLQAIKKINTILE